MSDWRDTNGMTVAERAAAMWPLGRYSQELVAIGRADLVAFGEACANAELERCRSTQVELRLKVEAERDESREEAAKWAEDAECWQKKIEHYEDALGLTDQHAIGSGIVSAIQQLQAERAVLAETAARLRTALTTIGEQYRGPADRDMSENAYWVHACGHALNRQAVERSGRIPVSTAEAAAAERLKGGAK